MRALSLIDIKKFAQKKAAAPTKLAPYDLLLRVAYAGVCGSDIHYFKEGKIGDQVIEFPFIIGHEFSAVVEAAGSSVKMFKPGDRVTVDPAISCGKCSQCLAGRFNTCEKLVFLGCPGQLEGCYVDFIIMPERNCFKIPDGIDLKTAAFIEPLTIGYYALSFLQDREINSIGILGAGPIGMSVLLSAKEKGVNSICVTDKLNERLQLAKEIGATWIGNPLEININKEISNAGYLDAVFECCGKQEALDQAVELLRPGGILIIVGIPSEDFISFNISKIRRKELTIQNVRRQNEFVSQSIELANKYQEEITRLITHIYSPERIQEAFSTVENYEDGVLKALIEFSKN